MTSLFMVMLFLCFLPWDSGQQIRDARRDNHTSPAYPASLGKSGNFSCKSNFDCPEDSYCEDTLCECYDGHFIFIDRPNDKVTCEQCPNVHETCSVNKCCYPPGYTTCHNDVCQCNDDFHASECSDMDQFKLATQIALGSALILAIACLLGVLWSSCRRRNTSARRHQTRRRGASLTSIQRFVQERLQHRPPDYHDRRHIRIEKPPSYEDTLEQWRKWKYDDQSLVANAPLRYPIINAFAPTTTPDGQQQQQQHQQQQQQQQQQQPDIEMSPLNSDRRNRRHDEETYDVVGLAVGRDNPTFTISDEKDGTIEMEVIKYKNGIEALQDI